MLPDKRLRYWPLCARDQLRLENFSDFRCQNVEILEKIARCARQDHTKPDEDQDLAIGNTTSDDPAKMTHSIPDFVSRYEV